MKFHITTLRMIALAFLCLAFFAYVTKGASTAVVIIFAGGLAIKQMQTYQPGTLWVYSGVTLADIFIPEIYGTIQPNDSPETTAFAQSGVAVTNPLLQNAAQAGARKVEIPLWNDLDSSAAPNLSDDTDTLAVPGKVDTTSMDARNAFLNKAYSTADLATEIAGNGQGGTSGDPMTRIRNRFGSYWAKQFQYRIIAACRGIYASNVANNASDMVWDISLQTTVGQTADNKMSADAIVEAVFTMGDQFANLAAIAMHSIPYKTLVKQELIQYVKDSTGTLSVPIYLGKRVVVDDGLPVIAGTTSGFRYMSVLFGTAAIGYGEGTPKVPEELFRRPNAGNGGGLEDLWERKTWLIHPFGWDWTESSVAGESATLPELRTAANWTRVLVRKSVPMAFLFTNG